ncbi:MAG: PAS domain S-box protein [Candidatus Riflebacteria bacterium]|nr:PAS domain S-box protein [Candidatus Riflebacteria bacterium]
MAKASKDEVERLREQNESLKAQLAEAQETLRAIREGEVDALVVSGPGGDQVYSLAGTDSIYRVIVETMREAAITLTLEGTILYCNAQFGLLVKRSMEQLVGHRVHAFVDPDSRAAADQLLTCGPERAMKRRLLLRDSENRCVPVHVAAHLLDQPDGPSVCVVAADLTELESSTEVIQRLRAQQEALQAANQELAATEERMRVQNEELAASRLGLDRARARYQDLFETAPDGYVGTDAEGIIQEVNQAAARLFGRAAGDLVGNPLSALVPRGEREGYLELLGSMSAGQIARPGWEVCLRSAEGTTFWAAITAAASRDEEGNIVGLRWLVRDVSQTRKTEQALRESESQLRAVFLASQDALMISSDDGICVGANPAAERIFGRPVSEIIGTHAATHLEPGFDWAGTFTALKGEACSQGEVRLVRKDGTSIVTEFSAVADILPGRHLTVIRDISGRKRAEEALRDLNTQLERKVGERTAELASVIEKLQAEAAQRNQAAAQIRRTNRVLRMLGDCNEAVVRIEDQQQLMHEICRIAVEVGGYRMAWVGMAQDDPDRTIRPVASFGFEAGYLDSARVSWGDHERGRGPTGTAIRTGQIQIGSDFQRDGNLAPWREEALARGYRCSIALPIRQDQAVAGALTIYGSEPEVFDETQVEVLKELAEDLALGLDALRTRTALRESRDRLRALAGELTLAEHRERRRVAGVLHDHLQQLLVAGKFRLAVLIRHGDPVVEETAKELEKLLDGAIQASRSVTAELRPPILQEGGLAAGLQWLVRWMAEKHGLSVDLAVQPDCSPAAEDIRLLLFEAVRELLFNVVKHSGAKSATVCLRQLEGDLVHIVVSDRGRGFDSNALKPAGLAGGFGLFSIRERLELVGGQIQIDSTPGQGSRFSITAPLGKRVPAADAPVRPAARVEPAGVARSSAAPVPRARIRVMLADDHAVVRQGLARLLQAEPDLEVVGEAADGGQALALARDLQPDVILMDVSMPGISGIEATRLICGAVPGVRVLGLSMSEEKDRADAMLAAGACAYLSKSGVVEDLVAAIRSCMVGRRGH